LVKFRWREAASKARRGLSGGSERMSDFGDNH
jgi:hypothetical protein